MRDVDQMVHNLSYSGCVKSGDLMYSMTATIMSIIPYHSRRDPGDSHGATIKEITSLEGGEYPG